MMTSQYHKSVLLQESISALAIQPNGCYVDLTFGGGGHSREILAQLNEEGKLFAFDQDADAIANAWEDHRLHIARCNFSEAADYLLAVGIDQVHGVLADLGVSSHQLDHDESGFSYRDNISLDMRMSKDDPITAADILNSYSVENLQRIFQEFGEVRNAKTLAQRIVDARISKRFEKTNDLNEILNMIKFGHFSSYAAPVYQALRMEVNHELKVLEQMLDSISGMICDGGRFAVITFHSLEDRLVKNFMKYGEFQDEPTKDIFGKSKPWPWKLITKKPIVPNSEEIHLNSRSRSSKLRVIEKLNE